MIKWQKKRKKELSIRAGLIKKRNKICAWLFFGGTIGLVLLLAILEGVVPFLGKLTPICGLCFFATLAIWISMSIKIGRYCKKCGNGIPQYIGAEGTGQTKTTFTEGYDSITASTREIKDHYWECPNSKNITHERH